MEQSHSGYPPPSYQSAVEIDRQRSLRTLTHVLYALYAGYWLRGGVSGVVAVIINYLKRSETVGTPYEAHFEWQSRTVWMGLVGHLIGVALFIVLIGVPIL